MSDRQNLEEVADIRVQEAFRRLRQFAADRRNHEAGQRNPEFLRAIERARGLAHALREEEQLQINPNADDIPLQVAQEEVGGIEGDGHAVQVGNDHEFQDGNDEFQDGNDEFQDGNAYEIQNGNDRVVQDDNDRILLPTITPDVPKTVLISGVVPIGTFSDVIITKVISPSKFWLRPLSSSEDLRTLERQMAIFYEDENSKFRDPSYFIEEGAYNSGNYAFYSKSQRGWVRAICGYGGSVVTKNASVKMYLMDHGKMEHVPATSIRPLQRCFCNLPAQGLMAAFLGESEVEQGIAQDNNAPRNRNWTPETCLQLKSQLEGKRLQAAVTKICTIDFPCWFSKAEVVLKEQANSSSMIVGWNPVEGIFIRS